MYVADYMSPLGNIKLAADTAGICGLWFEGEKTPTAFVGTPGIRPLQADNAYEGGKTHTAHIGKSGDHHLYTDQADIIYESRDIPLFRDVRRWLDVYFSGREPDFSLSQSFCGTPFQLEVWEILRSIPYGETATYGEIAHKIAAIRGLKRMSAQAVGGAVAHNPISIIIPCHRVIGADGSLTGYGGGLWRKAKLLRLEGISNPDWMNAAIH